MLSFFKRTTKHFLNTSSPGQVGVYPGCENATNDVNSNTELTVHVEMNNDAIDNFLKNQPTYNSSSIAVQQQDINSNDNNSNITTTDNNQMASMTNNSSKKAQKRNKSKQNKNNLIMVNKSTNRHSTPPIMTINSASTSIATPLMTKRSEPQKIVHSVKPNVHFNEGTMSRDDKTTIMRSVSMSTTQLNDKNWDYDNDDKKLVINQEIKINELLKTLADKELKINDLRYEIEGLTSQLSSKNTSIECMKTNLKQTEDELETLKINVSDMNKSFVQLNTENSNLKLKNNELVEKMEDLNNEYISKITKIENELSKVKAEKEALDLQNIATESVRVQEMAKAEQTLETAIRQKNELEKQWENDFEKLRTINMAREQQMFEDFEWKLREVEKLCKKRLDDKEVEFNEKMELYEKEVLDKFQEAETELNDLRRYKSYEAEVTQLRGLTNDQQNSLNILSKQLSDFQTNERLLKDDLVKLQNSLNDETDRFQCEKSQLEQQLVNRQKQLVTQFEHDKRSLALECEKRLRDECDRLKSELEQIHHERQAAAITSIRNDHKLQIDELNAKWNEKFNENLHKLESLTDMLTKKETYYKEELKKLQTVKDNETLELRRAIDKMDFSYSDKIDKLIEEHNLELDQLSEKHRGQVDELEENYEKQLENMRTNFDLVKDQIHNEYEDKIEHINRIHQEELGRQWEKLLEEKDNFSAFIEDEYSEQLNQLKDELVTTKKCFQLKECEFVSLIDELSKQIKDKDLIIQKLQLQNNEFKTGYVNSDFRNIFNEQKQQLIDIEEQHFREMTQVQKQNQIVIDQLQQKCQCLNKLFETTKSRYEKREDQKIISDLRKMIREQENDISQLNEEKRYYQLQLLANNDNKFNKIYRSKSITGIDLFENCNRKSVSCPS